MSKKRLVVFGALGLVIIAGVYTYSTNDNVPALSPEKPQEELATEQTNTTNNSAPAVRAPTTQATTPTPQESLEEEGVSQTCNDFPELIADITDFSGITKITAPGSPSSEGPKGHSFVWTEGVRVPVYAPADVTLSSGSYYQNNAGSPAQYLLFFSVDGSCDFEIKFDHIDEPVPAISVLLPTEANVADSRTTDLSQSGVSFKAGELVGYTRGTREAGNWDFGLYNLKEEGPLAEHGSFGVHAKAICWVDYYSSGLSERYRALLEGPRLVCTF